MITEGSVVQQAAPLLAVENEIKVSQRAEAADCESEPGWEASRRARIDEELRAVVEYHWGVLADVIAS